MATKKDTNKELEVEEIVSNQSNSLKTIQRRLFTV